MENEPAPPEKAAGVEDVEMTEAELTARAAAAAVPSTGAAAAPSVPPGSADAAAAIEVEVEEEEDGELEETQETARVTGDYEDDSEASETKDLTTQYHHIISTVAGLDSAWLTVLKSYDADNVLQTRYRWEAFEQWHKLNDKATEINAELATRGQQPLPPAKMFPQVYEHLSTMGMNVLTDWERETGYADADLDDRAKQSFVDHEKESR